MLDQILLGQDPGPLTGVAHRNEISSLSHRTNPIKLCLVCGFYCSPIYLRSKSPSVALSSELPRPFLVPALLLSAALSNHFPLGPQTPDC